MKKLLLIFLFTTFLSNAQYQQRISFDYDSAGNQIRRYICLCTARASDLAPAKEISELNNDDLLKFSPSDLISYYPNPVKEELFLKWELVNENKVTKIDVFNVNGQLMKSFNELENENTKNIAFHEFSEGTYLVLLYFSNNEQKSITILKK